ncbi:helix-turn-helix domain-containing protein [Kribbella sp. NPDC051770]|uniref:TetR/AcrR family transcriptional regulator n=1 Tax=Kribbella sp. NPDC051770 TaxID=3155413 RepID=UPI0034499A12
MQQDKTRLAISRAATQLFWEQGVAATTGDQIAAAAGVSVRTVWRHFRTKESCAEPIVAHSWSWFLATWRSWPDDLSLEEHVAAEEKRRNLSPQQQADDRAAAQMIVLSRTEPAIRTAFLMSSDLAERELAPIVARRLRRAPDDLDVLAHTAAINAVVRVISEEIIVGALTRDERSPLADSNARIINAVRTATSNLIGDPIRRTS